jgi:cysteine desulfurase
MIYLDAAATTAVRREVLEAMWPYLTGEFGNPSSHHAVGHAAAEALKQARASVAEVLGCRASEIVFTAGGTEADNLALKGVALADPRGRHIVTTAIEHEAVLASCDYLRRIHGFEITYLPVDRFGMVDLAAFTSALCEDTTLCSIMLANNEVGTIQPIAALAAAAHAAAHTKAIPFHTDAVQAAGALDLNVKALDVDALSLSGHKIGAPKGTGLLYLKSRLHVEPVLHGGGQEKGRRSGTENVAGAVGIALALRLATEGRAARTAHLTTLRDTLIHGIHEAVPTALLTGHPTQRLPGSASFCFPGTSGESVLLHLEEQGIVCSSGSACAAGSDEPSHVLIAMGLPRDLSQTAVRFTLGEAITEDQITQVIASVRDAVQAVSSIGQQTR